ncbi:MAG: FGGY-family carbohydrate kinase [Chloroflexota bacterium]|nr:FGGY-family carbohydrate kinase [Chloroflexota bacterium]
MAEKFLIGVDVGTYETKGVITNLKGEVLSTQVRPHKMLIPHQGWAEHDPEGVWWGDFVDVTKRLLETSGVDPKDILSVGCSAIGICVLPIDKEGNPLRDGGILYGVDTRATKEIAYLEKEIGSDKIFKKAGMTLSSQAAAPKIMWLKHNEPEAYKKTHKFVTATTFIVGRLTGNYVIDHLTGSFVAPLYDFEQRKWTDELTKEIVELDRLPELRWATEIAGTVTADAAKQTGLLEGTPVTVGTADAAAESVSVGVTNPGQMMLMYGSTVFIIEVLDKPIADERMWANPYLFEGTSALLAGMATSGSLTRWFRDQLTYDLVAAEENGGPNAYGAITKEASDISAGSEGLICLPFFSGERTPINDPKARGVYFGLTLAHSRAHMFKATLEGIGYGVRHHLNIMRDMGAFPDEVIAVGGGTKSPLWLQVVSDIGQISQKVPAVTLGASYGDAFLAGIGVGVFSDPTDINKWVNDSRMVYPDKSVAEKYEKYMALYLDLYEQNKELMHRIYELA